MWMASKNGKKQLFLGALPGAQLFFGVLLSASLLGSGLVVAEDNIKRDRGFYVGGGIGQSTFSNLDNICQNLLTQAGAAGSCDNKGFAYKAYAGYQFIRYFGVEVGYANFGKAQASVNSPALGNIDYKSQGVFVEGVVFVPLYNRWSALVKGGVLGWRTNLDIPSSLGLPSQSATGWSGMWGGGFQYMITDAFGMRAEYEYYNSMGDAATTGATHIKVISIEGLLKF